jgi:Fe-S cluster biogenesis protein NfuA
MELIDQVEKALDNIRPYLIADGGNVKVINIDENNVVFLELLGSCGSCPMSAMTLKAGVEESIKRAVPSISAVKAVNLTTHDDPHAKLPQTMM